LFNFPEEQSQPPVPTLDIDITVNKEFVNILERHQKIHTHVKKLKLKDILVEPLRSIVETIKGQWFKVLKRTYHDYRLHTVSQMMTQVFNGEVKLMVNGMALGKPFLVNTDARQKESYKHSKNYFDDILTTINGQLTKLKLIITGCNEIKMTERGWDRILKDIRLAA
jgi:hypothetical protein